MNHQLYEEWILSEEKLNEEQEEQLKQHLISCLNCQSLAYAWNGVRAELDKPASASPAPGFKQRFEVSLAKSREHEQRKKLFMIIGLGLILGVAAVLVLLTISLLSGSFNYYIANFITTLAGVMARSNQIVVAARNIFTAFPAALPITVAALLGALALFGVLTVAWFKRMKKILETKGINAR